MRALHHDTAILRPYGLRTWLPFLQFHLKTLGAFKVEPHFFSLIPAFYYIFSLLILNKIYLKLTKKIYFWKHFLFSISFLLFSQYEPFIKLGISLYQESISSALLLLLIYRIIIQKKLGVIENLILTASILTREYNWIYFIYFLPLIFIEKKFNSLQKIIFMINGILTACFWLWVSHQGFLPTIDTKGTPITLHSFFNRTLEIHQVIFKNWIGAYISLVFISFFYFNKNLILKKINYLIFGSLITIYLIFIFFDPFQTSPYNNRMSYPFIFLPFIAFASIYATSDISKWKQLFSVHFFILFIFIYPLTLNWSRHVSGYFTKVQRPSYFHQTIEIVQQFKSETKHNNKYEIIIYGFPFFNAIHYFHPSLLYARPFAFHTQLYITENSGLIFSSKKLNIENFFLLKEVKMHTAQEEFLYIYKKVFF
jgi:hypothetical protein